LYLIHFSLFLFFYLSFILSLLISCNLFMLLEFRNTKYARWNPRRMLITETESGFLEHFFLKKNKKKKTKCCINKVFTIGIKVFFAARFTGSVYLQSLSRHVNCIIYAAIFCFLQFLRSK
jgi:hypothetical protein